MRNEEKIVTDYLMKIYEKQSTPENTESKPLLQELSNLEDQVAKLRELNKILANRLTPVLKPCCEAEDNKCEEEKLLNCSETTHRIKKAAEHIRELQTDVGYLLDYLEI
jgi:hypothetical protein